MLKDVNNEKLCHMCHEFSICQNKTDKSNVNKYQFSFIKMWEKRIYSLIKV